MISVKVPPVSTANFHLLSFGCDNVFLGMQREIMVIIALRIKTKFDPTLEDQNLEKRNVIHSNSVVIRSVFIVKICNNK